MPFLLSFLLLSAIQVTSVVWSEAPPSMPPGTKIAVLEGSPAQAGMFTIRLRIPTGSTIATHTHPRPERVTVISGKATVSFGEGKNTTFTAGGFYVNPPDIPHSLSFEEETVLQLTCEGPWEMKYGK